MRESDEYKLAVQDCYAWQYKPTNSFYQCLFTMFQKADRSNRNKLAIAFPFHYQVFQDWNEAAEYGNELFKKHGLIS